MATKPTAPAPKKQTTLFGEQWMFYKMGYHQMLKLLMGAAGVIVTLTLFSIYLYFQSQQPPAYFAVDAQGRLSKLEPVNIASISDIQVKNFVAEAIPAAFSLRYDQYETDMSRVASYFSDDGFGFYKDTVEKKILPQIKERNLLMRTVLKEAPSIHTQGVTKLGENDSRWLWTITVPTIRTMTDGVTTKNYEVTYMVDVVRVSSLYRPQQIAILRVIQK